MTTNREEILAAAQHYRDQLKRSTLAFNTNDGAAYTGFIAEATNALRKVQVLGKFRNTDMAAAFVRAEHRAGNLK